MNEMTMVPRVAFTSAQGSDHQIWFQFIYILLSKHHLKVFSFNKYSGIIFLMLRFLVKKIKILWILSSELGF